MQNAQNHQVQVAAPRGGKRGRAGNARGGAVQLPDPEAESFERWARTLTSKAAVEDYLKTNPIDPKNLTLEVIERDLWAEAQQLKFMPSASRDTRLRYTFYRVLSKGSIPTVYMRIRAAALKLLPGLQQMADRGCALKGYTGMRVDPEPGEPGARIVDPDDPTKLLLLADYSNPPWDPANLRAVMAHCESPLHVEKLKAFCRSRGYDERDFKHGDVALPPLLISAPPRKGKTAIALAHVWFARRMGFAVQYGVAPNTNLVSQELHGLLVRLGWWNNPAILGDCINGSDVQGVKARAFDEALQRKRYDVVLFSSDNNNHAKATAADIERRAVKLTASVAPEDARHGPDDDGLRGDVDDDARAAGCTDVFVLIRDEAQTNARFGAEEEEDKLAVAESLLAREQAALTVAERAPDADQLVPGIKRRIAGLTKNVETKQKAFDRKLASSQELLRPTFVSSKGFQVLVSATLLPTLQERQLWGTLLEENLPAELDVGQDRFALPALGPEGHKQYVGAQCTDDAKYRRAYAPELVREWTFRLLKDRISRKIEVYRTLFRDAEREVTRLETEEGRHPDDPEYKMALALKTRLDALLTASKTELREANQRIPAYSDELFERPQFADKRLLLLDGGAIFGKKVDAHGVPVATRTTKAVIATIAQARARHGVARRRHWRARRRDRPPDRSARGQRRARRGARRHPADDARLPAQPHNAHQDVRAAPAHAARLGQPHRQALLRAQAAGLHRGVCVVDGRQQDHAQHPGDHLLRRRQAAQRLQGLQAPGHRLRDRPSAHNPAEFEIKPLAAPVADMDGVVSMLTARTNRFDAIGHYKLYAVGYDMFNGALTLSRAMNVDVFARDEDGVERIQPQTRTVLAAPQRILFAHTNTRSIDSIYQIVGRTYNDLHFACPNFRIEILTGVSARGNLIAYAMAEDAFIAATGVPAGCPLQGDAGGAQQQQQPALQDDLDDEGVAMDYEDAVPVPAVVAPERVRLPMHECVRSAHTAFAQAPILAKDEGMQTYELSQLVLGRKRRTMASTVGRHAPITLEELRARGSHALALDDWEAPEEEEYESDSDLDSEADSDAEIMPERNDGVLARSLPEFLALYRQRMATLTKENSDETYEERTINTYCAALETTLVEHSEFFNYHGHARPGMQGKRCYPDHLPTKDKDPKWVQGGEHYEVVQPGGKGKGRVSSAFTILRRMFAAELQGDKPCSAIFKSDRVAKAAAAQQMDRFPLMDADDDM